MSMTYTVDADLVGLAEEVWAKSVLLGRQSPTRSRHTGTVEGVFPGGGPSTRTLWKASVWEVGLSSMYLSIICFSSIRTHGSLAYSLG